MDKEPKPPKQTVISIEPPLGGLISEFAPIANPIEGAEGQYRYSFGATAIRPGYLGKIAPAEIPDQVPFTDASFNVNSLPRAVVADNTNTPTNSPLNTTYYLTGGLSGTAPTLIRVAGGAVTDGTIESVSWPHSIAPITSGGFATIPAVGTGFWGEDVVFYPGLFSEDQNNLILYSWNDSGVGSVGCFNLTTGSIIADHYLGPSYFNYPGTSTPVDNLIANVPHRMCYASMDGTIYITNGRYIANFNASKTAASQSSGDYDDQYLSLAPGWTAVDVIDYQGEYVAVLAVREGGNYATPGTGAYNTQVACDARIFLFAANGPLDPTQTYDLEDWYGSSLFMAGEFLYAFTQGKNGTTKVKVLSPYPPFFQTIFEMPTSYIGNAPLPNQVELFNGRVCWATSTGLIVSIQQGAQGFMVHTPYAIATEAGVLYTAVGFLKNVSGNILSMGLNSSGATPPYFVRGIKGDGTSYSLIVQNSPTFYPEFRTRLIDIGYRNTIVKIKAYFLSFDSASSMLISLIPGNTPYSLTDGLPTGDLLNWNVNVSNHPNIAKTLVGSTAELGGKVIPDISQLWLNFRFTLASTTTIPPILRKLEIIVEETQKP